MYQLITNIKLTAMTKWVRLDFQKFSATPNRFNWSVRNFRRLQIDSIGLSEIFCNPKWVRLDCIQFE